MSRSCCPDFCVCLYIHIIWSCFLRLCTLTMDRVTPLALFFCKPGVAVLSTLTCRRDFRMYLWIPGKNNVHETLVVTAFNLQVLLGGLTSGPC